ncbi:hypothetical protein SEQ01_16750 [Streptococcus equinus]|nr:hypothetical protein SEQ01_16750 [Streptococcus equinus]
MLNKSCISSFKDPKDLNGAETTESTLATTLLIGDETTEITPKFLKSSDNENDKSNKITTAKKTKREILNFFKIAHQLT